MAQGRLVGESRAEELRRSLNHGSERYWPGQSPSSPVGQQSVQQQTWCWSRGRGLWQGSASRALPIPHSLHSVGSGTNTTEWARGIGDKC